MDRQGRARDTVLVRSREMTGRNQTPPWWRGGGVGVKTTANKINLACCKISFNLLHTCMLVMNEIVNKEKQRRCRHEIFEEETSSRIITVSSSLK